MGVVERVEEEGFVMVEKDREHVGMAAAVVREGEAEGGGVRREKGSEGDLHCCSERKKRGVVCEKYTSSESDSESRGGRDMDYFFSVCFD